MHVVYNDEQRILVIQAAPGLVLSRAVALPNKVVLCPLGATLTYELIHILIARGIKFLFVKGTPFAAGMQVGFTLRRERLHHSFSRVREFPHMALMERLIERQIVQR